jgi:hypothetical protein
MTEPRTNLTLAEITREVAEERGVPVPPDTDTMTPEDEHSFWDEVQSRFDAQDG